MKKELLIDIFKYHFLEKLSYREIAAKLNIDRRTVSRYVHIMEKNIQSLKDNPSPTGKSGDKTTHAYIFHDWEDYMEDIIAYKATRKKKALTPTTKKAIYRLTEVLNTTSPQRIYDFIYENYEEFQGTIVDGLTYSSIWRALQEKQNEDESTPKD
ncbi:sigma factor-like helix-turn-helix DNA-binding protein [Natronincola ferrireducens]|uniref:Homeodomain-like domain-containing protein n=1 Tax=Natronincola ferrireducens TaxID=393762 RepID=A0A1G9CKC8_9FIRM|nr:sigma factor-like helix-turn-helix DNA-binding protein [Natronincola ferrireducens]SDK52147.1 Homeodomain-like domain-containing protein [Natronincola ferrireducens]